MAHENRFDGKGDVYAKARPKYAPSLFDYLKDTLGLAPGSVIGDIGSGTGLFTEQLLERGYRVYAVEPNGDMRRKAEEKLSVRDGFISVDGRDTDTRLPDACLDAVTVAQAFHWFDAEGFRRECRRVLKPNGKVILVYNTRDEEAACTKALKTIRARYSAEFHGFSNGVSPEQCQAFFNGSCQVFRADNAQIYDRQGYIDRALSSSYSPREGDARYLDYLRDLNALFDAFAIDGQLRVPIDTVAYIGPGRNGATA